jgi:phage shock protein A
MDMDGSVWERFSRDQREQHEGFETKLFHRIDKLERNLMAKLEALETAVSTLNTDVQALVAAQGEQVTQEQVDAVTQQVDTIDTAVKDATPAPTT